MVSEIEMSPLVLGSKNRKRPYGLWALWKTRCVGFPSSGGRVLCATGRTWSRSCGRPGRRRGIRGRCACRRCCRSGFGGRQRRNQFARGRPYKKDDNAHIEQKNWTQVRKLLGYVRYDSELALAAINAGYADLRLLQNLFLPTVKLVSKERVGARVRRRYDRPETPLERVRQSTGIRDLAREHECHDHDPECGDDHADPPVAGRTPRDRDAGKVDKVGDHGPFRRTQRQLNAGGRSAYLGREAVVERRKRTRAT